MDIANKTILITGAARGIGRALVDEALRRGVRRLYAGTRGELQSVDARVTPLALDVTSARQIERAAKDVAAIDILINNAGIALGGGLGDPGLIEQHMAVNLYGLLNMTLAFQPLLKRSRGAVVNVLSLAALAPVPVLCAYSLRSATRCRLTDDLHISPVFFRRTQSLMRQTNYSTSFLVDQSPDQVFAAINNPRAWWAGEFEGATNKPGAEFVYKYKTFHRSTQKIVEFVPAKKVVWRVVDAHLSFLNDKAEWKDTDIVFEISKRGGKTELRFTHAGLHPGRECYGACSNAWGTIVNGSLHGLITTGKGRVDQAL